MLYKIIGIYDMYLFQKKMHVITADNIELLYNS